MAEASNTNEAVADEQQLSPSASKSPTSSGTNTGSSSMSNKVSVQLKKLTDANAKYKNLLKLAKERIQKQEEETIAWKAERSRLEESIEELKKNSSSSNATATTVSSNQHSNSNNSNRPPDSVTNILRIARRIRNTPLFNPYNGANIHNINKAEEIWALMDMEDVSEEAPHTNRRYQEWMRFATEADLMDHVRRDTGEPLVPPPYSFSPEQAAELQQQSEQTVASITEEFRRFRVRAELAKEQAAVQLREVQQRAANTATQSRANNSGNTGGGGDATETATTRLQQQQMERMKMQMATQEAQWKEAYDRLVDENTALQSKGSEAMLAAQWRQRYEVCCTEKEALEEQLKRFDGGVENNSTGGADAEKYEQKYRDLKESFRLYRKKAKEIFEAQQVGEGGGLSSAAAMQITSNSSADAKLSYLKNLMINYLTADPTVRDHMEGAIGTVLQFTADERKRVESKRTNADSWF